MENLFSFSTESEYGVVNRVLTVLGCVSKHIPDGEIDPIAGNADFN